MEESSDDLRPESAGLPVLDVDHEKDRPSQPVPGPKRTHPIHSYYENDKKGSYCAVKNASGAKCGVFINGFNTSNLKKHLQRPRNMLAVHRSAWNDYCIPSDNFRENSVFEVFFEKILIIPNRKAYQMYFYR